MEAIKSIIGAVDEFSSGMGRSKLTSFAAAGAYYLFMSLVPLIMLLCSLMQYTPLTEQMIMEAVAEYVPVSMYQIVSRIVSTVYDGGGAALTVSIALTLWSASASMKALMRGMDAAYQTDRRENYIIFSLRACLYMLVFVIMLAVSLAVMVYGGSILNLIQSYMPADPALDYIFGLLHYLRFVVVMVILTLVFLLLYRWMPALRQRYAKQLPGALFASVSWVVFSWVFSMYVTMSNKFGAYGFLGTIMVAMMWMYFCLYFLLIGGYINHWADGRRRGEKDGE